MSSVNDVMKMAFFGPSSPDELDGLDLSALKSFEMRGNGWSVTLYDRGGDGQQPAAVWYLGHGPADGGGCRRAVLVLGSSRLDKNGCFVQSRAIEQN